jgi:hypothetical protein
VSIWPKQIKIIDVSAFKEHSDEGIFNYSPTGFRWVVDHIFAGNPENLEGRAYPNSKKSVGQTARG